MHEDVSGAEPSGRSARPLRLLRGEHADLDLAAVCLGVNLARLHRARPAVAGIARRPWSVLDAVDRLGAGQSDQEAAARRLSAVLADPSVRACLEVVEAAWGPHAPVHGSVPADGVRFRGPGPGMGVCLSDAAESGLGHPAWDVTAALSALDELDTRERGRPRSRSVFLLAYARAGGVHPVPSPEWGCVLALTGSAALLGAQPFDGERFDLLLSRALTAAGSAIMAFA